MQYVFFASQNLDKKGRFIQICPYFIEQLLTPTPIELTTFSTRQEEAPASQKLKDWHGKALTWVHSTATDEKLLDRMRKESPGEPQKLNRGERFIRFIREGISGKGEVRRQKESETAIAALGNLISDASRENKEGPEDPPVELYHRLVLAHEEKYGSTVKSTLSAQVEAAKEKIQEQSTSTEYHGETNVIASRFLANINTSTLQIAEARDQLSKAKAQKKIGGSSTMDIEKAEDALRTAMDPKKTEEPKEKIEELKKKIAQLESDLTIAILRAPKSIQKREETICKEAFKKIQDEAKKLLDENTQFFQTHPKERDALEKIYRTDPKETPKNLASVTKYRGTLESSMLLIEADSAKKLEESKKDAEKKNEIRESVRSMQRDPAYPKEKRLLAALLLPSLSDSLGLPDFEEALRALETTKEDSSLTELSSEATKMGNALGLYYEKIRAAGRCMSDGLPSRLLHAAPDSQKTVSQIVADFKQSRTDAKEMFEEIKKDIKKIEEESEKMRMKDRNESITPLKKAIQKIIGDLTSSGEKNRLTRDQVTSLQEKIRAFDAAVDDPKQPISELRKKFVAIRDDYGADLIASTTVTNADIQEKLEKYEIDPTLRAQCERLQKKIATFKSDVADRKIAAENLYTFFEEIQKEYAAISLAFVAQNPQLKKPSRPSVEQKPSGTSIEEGLTALVDEATQITHIALAEVKKSFSPAADRMEEVKEVVVTKMEEVAEKVAAGTGEAAEKFGAFGQRTLERLRSAFREQPTAAEAALKAKEDLAALEAAIEAKEDLAPSSKIPKRGKPPIKREEAAIEDARYYGPSSRSK